MARVQVAIKEGLFLTRFRVGTTHTFRLWKALAQGKSSRAPHNDKL